MISSFALKRELLDSVIDKRLVIDDASRPFLCGPGLECRESLRFLPLDILRSAGMRIDADPLPRRSAEELVNRNAQRLPLDVPKRLIDAAERAGQNRAAPIKGVTINGLPVMRHRARVFSNQVRFHFLDRLSAGEGAPLRDRLPETGDAGIGVDLEEQPPGFDQEGFQSCDLDAFFDGGSPFLGVLHDRRVAVAAGRSNACHEAGCAQAKQRRRPLQYRPALNTFWVPFHAFPPSRYLSFFSMGHGFSRIARRNTESIFREDPWEP